ncbi:hypothetical protein HW132_13445 [Brasilonema sp. CT11]|nr:hypothetical protein [Brasilonema sp. CT11]
MNAKRVFFGFLTATLALTSLTTLKPASAVEQFNHQTIQSAHTKANFLVAKGGAAAPAPTVNLNIDPSELTKQINDLVVAKNNREGFVKGLMEKANQAANGKLNVMVFNLSQPYENQIRGQKYFEQVDYHGVLYGIWIFEDGTFINQGDGGFINWAFHGKFQRSGDQGHTVTFEKL